MLRNQRKDAPLADFDIARRRYHSPAVACNNLKLVMMPKCFIYPSLPADMINFLRMEASQVVFAGDTTIDEGGSTDDGIESRKCSNILVQPSHKCTL